MDTAGHDYAATRCAGLVNALGSSLFVLLFWVRVEQGLRGSPLAWFLAFQSGLVTFRILFRQTSKQDAPAPIRALAWFSALAPLAILTPPNISLLPLPGLALSIWSLLALGDSFGIAPSDRGLVQRGPYRFIRHPMYAGELLSLLGLCLFSPAIWNWAAFTVFCWTVYIRIIEEETIIDGYYGYARQVAWRLVPFIW